MRAAGVRVCHPARDVLAVLIYYVDGLRGGIHVQGDTKGRHIPAACQAVGSSCRGRQVRAVALVRKIQHGDHIARSLQFVAQVGGYLPAAGVLLQPAAYGTRVARVPDVDDDVRLFHCRLTI